MLAAAGWRALAPAVSGDGDVEHASGGGLRAVLGVGDGAVGVPRPVVLPSPIGGGVLQGSDFDDWG
jgi:hypothetical protein